MTKFYMRCDFHQWLALNAARLAPYYKNRTDHEAVDLSTAMDSLAECIKNGDLEAAAIGLDLLANDPMMPFGKVIKSKILNSLRRNAASLNETEWQLFADLHSRWSCMKPYPPREFRYLVRLLKLQPDGRRG